MSILSFGQRGKRRAEKLHEQGMSLSDNGDDEGAIGKYLAAINVDSERPTTLYNIGLIYKYRNDWTQSFDFNQRAYALAPDDESARWNLAIAATALRRWKIARQMWADQGIELSGNSGPIEMEMGRTPVRLNTESDGEVVWTRRIDPVRARIESVPLPESGFRCGDIVLHDGAAVGHRIFDDLEYPVFNVLELFEPSLLGTFVAVVETDAADAIDHLHRLASNSGIRAEDWTQSVRMICRQCSEGTPHDDHDNELRDDAWVTRRKIGIAAPSPQKVDALLKDWTSSTNSQLTELSCELEVP